MLCTERDTNHTKYLFFDKNWNLLRINKAGLEAEENFSIPKPELIDEMYNYAEILAKPFKFVRVDFYNCKGKIIFGELTFTPCACMDNNYTKEAQQMLGNMLTL